MEFVIKLHHSRYNCVYTTRRNEGETQFRAVCDNAAKRNIVPSTSQCHNLYISYVYALITVVMNLFWDLEFKQAFLRTTLHSDHYLFVSVCLMHIFCCLFISFLILCWKESLITSCLRLLISGLLCSETTQMCIRHFFQVKLALRVRPLKRV